VSSAPWVAQFAHWKDEEAVVTPEGNDCNAACIGQLIFTARKTHNGQIALTVTTALVRDLKAEGSLSKVSGVYNDELTLGN